MLLHCPKGTEELEELLANQEAPPTWESVTNTNIKPKKLLQFMTDSGLISAIQIITAHSDAREVDSELEADI